MSQASVWCGAKTRHGTVKAALRVKRARGERFSRRAPLGLRFEDGRLVEDAAERAVLERVRTMRSGGLSLARVASRLNAEGLKCRGGCWQVTSLARALRRGGLMARPLVGPKKDMQLVVRLPNELRRRVEALRVALSKRAGGVDLVYSHVVREIIERGCESIERELRR